MQDNTLLLRQVHPSFVQNKIVSTQAFVEKTEVVAALSFEPSPKDEKKLSVYNGDKFTPEESFRHYTQRFVSHGVLSVSKSECESVDSLTATEDNHPFDGHAYIDFTNISSNNQITKRAKKLRDIAVKRGWLYNAD